jgi:hypothetical protein
MATYQVGGVVSCAVSSAVGGLHVSIVDKNVAGDIELANATTGDLGAYSASFDDAELKERKKALPDLQARVFAGETFLGASAVRYNASKQQALDVVLAGNALHSLRSEYEALGAALTPYYQGKLGDLKETGAQRQITYLANKTGWDARTVALAGFADQFARRATAGAGLSAAPTIPPEFYHALFGVGLPTDASLLHAAPIEQVGTIWTQAVDPGLIPGAPAEDTPQALKAFRAIGTEKILDLKPVPRHSILRELLKRRLGDDAEPHLKFSDIYLQPSGRPHRLLDHDRKGVRCNYGRQAAVRRSPSVMTMNKCAADGQAVCRRQA